MVSRQGLQFLERHFGVQHEFVPSSVAENQPSEPLTAGDRTTSRPQLPTRTSTTEGTGEAPVNERFFHQAAQVAKAWSTQRTLSGLPIALARAPPPRSPVCSVVPVDPSSGRGPLSARTVEAPDDAAAGDGTDTSGQDEVAALSLGFACSSGRSSWSTALSLPSVGGGSDGLPERAVRARSFRAVGRRIGVGIRLAVDSAAAVLVVTEVRFGGVMAAVVRWSQSWWP